MSIEKVAVIGAGVMGAGIAAHFTNAGVPVLLLDIVPEGAKKRDVVAETAVKKLLKAQPAPFMQQRNAKLLTTGNIEDDLEQLKAVDWVVEAVVENPKIKKSLYQKLHQVCPQQTLISSNTSTLPLSILMHDMPESFRQRFLITHFFNPPRYMRLLEIVTAEEIDPQLLETLLQFADVVLGKGCVQCKDTPGFIANRIGIYWLQYAMLRAMELELTVEQADAAICKAMRVPKTGVFGLLDLVGLDLIPHILDGMKLALPKADAFHAVNTVPELLGKMIQQGYTGRKGKGGFYRLNKEAGKKVKESIDLRTGEYAKSVKPQKPDRATATDEQLQLAEKLEHYAWDVMSHTLVYAADLVYEIADDVQAIDNAMRWGYNWDKGPFELLDQFGVEKFVAQLKAQQRAIPDLLAAADPMYKVQDSSPCFYNGSGHYQPLHRNQGVLLLADFKHRQAPVLQNASASLWDIGDGLVCLEFHSKMNTLDMEIMELLQQSISKVSEEFSALIIHNEAENFSAGANLTLLMQAIHTHNWEAVKQLIQKGQQTYLALKYAPFPVVAAPSGLALGGGCEILLHCDAIQAHAELYTGLVEVGVGLIPGWGGCKEYLARQLRHPKRFGGPVPPVSKAFETISLAKVSTSAFDAKQLLFLAPEDGITMNKERLLADAKTKALNLLQDYHVPEAPEFALPGASTRVLLTMAVRAFRMLGKATVYDQVVASQLATILGGGDGDITEPLSEQGMLDLELESFVYLVQQQGTLDRLQHMLQTGKPLRN